MGRKRIVYKCEFIDSCAMHGFNEIEVRATEIKSAMRYWWRAISLFSKKEELLEKEQELFGSTKQISPFTIYAKQRDEKYFIVALEEDKEGVEIENYAALFELACILGGFGRGVRRESGSCFILKKLEIERDGNQNVEINRYKLKNDKYIADRILELIEKIQQWSLKGKSMEITEGINGDNYKVIKSKKCSNRYPSIEEIWIGEKKVKIKDLINRVKDAKKELKIDKRYQYNFGNGEYASQVYASSYPVLNKRSELDSSLVIPIIILLSNTSLNKLNKDIKDKNIKKEKKSQYENYKTEFREKVFPRKK